MQETPGIILSIAFEKAFDCKLELLFKTLKKNYLGKNYINYVKTMYNNIKVNVLYNGSTISYFKLEWGVRQGCPLSAYLFLVLIETLTNKIRNDKSIEGIIID